MDILIDFDGTVVTHNFPNIGYEISAEPVLREIIDNGHNLILFTMRSDIKDPFSDDIDIHSIPGEYLTDAVKWFSKRSIPLYGVQTNPTQKTWTTSPKAYGQYMIDDSAIGCPLKMNPYLSNRPFVDWNKMRYLLIEKGIIKSNSISKLDLINTGFVENPNGGFIYKNINIFENNQGAILTFMALVDGGFQYINNCHELMSFIRKHEINF